MAAARASASSSKSAAKKSGSTSAKRASSGSETEKKSTAAKKSGASTVKKSTPKKRTAKKAVATKPAAAKKTASKKTPSKKTAAKKPAASTTTTKSAAKKATKKSPAKPDVPPAKATPPSKRSTSSKNTSSDPSKGSVKLPKFLTDKKWLDSQRQMLLEERQSYTHSAEALAAEAASLMADREPGDVQFDEESGEGDTLAVERDRDLALSAKAREKIEEIDAALARLDAGTYGLCVMGGDVIPKERLEALPMAPKCVTHQTAMF